MKKTEMSIEVSTPDGRTTGPIPEEEFKRGVKLIMQQAKTVQSQPDEKPQYWHDPALDQIGAELIQKYHNHLLPAEIKFLVTSKAMSRNGRPVFGKASKPSGLLGYFARCDFLILVQADFWQDQEREKRAAIVDHQLSHCSVEYDEEGLRSWILVGPDIEEFTAIVDRHGLWHDGLKTFGQAVARQLELPLNNEAKAQK